MFVSAYRQLHGVVQKTPVAILRAELWIGSSMLRSDFEADVYKAEP